MTEPRDPSPQRATGVSGVAGSRRDAGEPTGSSVPEIDLPEPSTERGGRKEPTSSSLSEMVTETGQPEPPVEVEPVTNSGLTDPYSPTGTAGSTGSR
ncbi:hypothetical protein ACNTMW_30305 [Planosporangium sp. 12N6]|uniref:hypothetical protein n=1 Tax=Planosporangium spinosum TaxID=3402278 RepID=UPI003CFB5A5F